MSNKKVLIVDDEQSIRLFLKLTLTSQGYETIEAVSGEEALTKAMVEKPDMIMEKIAKLEKEIAEDVQNIKAMIR